MSDESRIQQLQQELNELQQALPTVTGIVATLISGQIAERYAQLRLLEGSRSEQRQEASDGGQITLSPQVQAGGDVRDSQISSNNVSIGTIIVQSDGGLSIDHLRESLSPSEQQIDTALQTYLSMLFDRYQLLSLRGIGGGTRRQLELALQAVYINLQTGVTLPSLLEQPSIEQHLDRNPDLLRWVAELFPSSALHACTRAVQELLRQSPRLLILGAPGSGKSTWSRMVAVCCALDRLARRHTGLFGQLSPMITPLPSCTLWSARTLGTDVLSAQLDSGSGQLLVIDGVDELQGPQLAELITAIDQLLRTQPSCQLLITCRETRAVELDTLSLSVASIKEDQAAADALALFVAFERQYTEPRTALEMVRHERALVFLGDPGCGKTTVLRYLALGFAHARLRVHEPDATLDPKLAWPGRLPLPVFVQLRRFAVELTAAPHDASALKHHLESVLKGDQLVALAHDLTNRLEAGEMLVMLDGLDEVPDSTHRSWVITAIAQFQSRYPHNRIVVTCREYAYAGQIMLPLPFRAHKLQPLTAEDQNDFIGRWYRAVRHTERGLTDEQRESSAQISRQDLIGALDLRPGLREVAANPLLLTMIAMLHYHGTGLPQQRAELYEACLELLLQEWEQQRSDGEAGLAASLGIPDRLKTKGERLALIQPIAYELQQRGREEARAEEVRKWLLDRFLDLTAGQREPALTLIARFLDFLEGRSGLLIARDLQNQYAFVHRTFQEYLAARELVRQDTAIEEAIRHRHDPGWREVIRLSVGHLVAGGTPEKAKQIGWKLLDQEEANSSPYHQCSILAGEVVEELGDSLGTDGRHLRSEVVQRLVRLVEQGQLAASERVEAARLLGRLGDPRPLLPDQPGFWCEIAAGTFWYGDDRRENLQPLELSHTYRIGRIPITNAAFSIFLAANGGQYNPSAAWWTQHGRTFLAPGGHPVDDQNEWIRLPRYWQNTRFNQPNQPVVGISWYEAAAYCAWLTAQGHEQGWLATDAEIRLPTWLEWQRAARGDNQRRYPWGDDAPTPEHANYNQTRIGATSPVGCFPLGQAACGALDMAGNAMEWTATPDAQPTEEEARKDFTSNEIIVMSYTGWSDGSEPLCCGARIRNIPGNRGSITSFRIVQSLARAP